MTSSVTRRTVAALVAGGLAAALLGTVSAAPAAAAGTGVVISEIHYHALSDLDTDDFLELTNTGDTAVDVGGWSFSAGIVGVLPVGTQVPAGGRVVLSPDAARFQALYGFAPDAVYTGKLSNSGEAVTLVDAALAVVDTVTYADLAPWPPSADGTGPSLELRSLTADNALPRNWGASTTAGGTPRAVNSLDGTAPPPLVEALTATPRRPAPAEPVVVSARLPEASVATLTYKVMFGADVTVPFPDDAASQGGAGDGVHGATIPGQTAGQLVRYRVDATAGGLAFSAPPAGDSTRYEGVVVTDPAVTSSLPVVEWFVEDAVYDDLDTNHRCDDVTGQAVLAYAGTVYDNVRVKTRGQSSCTAPKVSWKVEMAPGHDMDFRPYMPYLLDEFALQRDPDPLTDVAWPNVGATGARDLALEAVRIQRNGRFHSVGRFMELEDGTWRDAEGVKDWAIYKGDAGGLRTTANAATLAASLDLDKKTRETEDFSDVWTLTQAVDAPASEAQKAWLEQNVNIPVLVNYMALNTVMRHQDSGWKNWFVARDTPGTGRWELWHWDLNWTFTTPAEDGKGEFITPEGSNQLLQALLEYPEYRQMYFRRLRTLSDEMLAPGRLEAQWDSFSTYDADWLLDNQRWGLSTPTTARAKFLRGLDDRRTTIAAYTGTGRPVPRAQSAAPSVVLSEIAYAPAAGPDAEFVELTNVSAESVDLSGWTLDGLGAVPGTGTVLQPGTVLLPGARLVLVAKDTVFRATYPQAGVLVAGEYRGRLSDTGQTLRLLQGTRVVDEVTYAAAAPWPAAANATGPSLELLDAGLDNALPESWVAVNDGGTPGRANLVAPPADTTPPSAPGTPVAAQGPSGVELGWTPATDDRGVAAYRVLRNGALVATVPFALEWVDEQALPSTAYTYAVAAVDAAGNVGPASAPVGFTTPGPVVLATEPFTGATGAAWPARWTTTATAGALTIQANTGRLAVNNTTGAQAQAVLSGLAARTDSDVRLSYRWSPTGSGGFLNVFARGSGGWASGYRPRNGYGLELSSSSTSVSLKKSVGGTATTLATVSGAQSVSTAKQWLRLRVSGSTVQFKSWVDGTAEPAAWRSTVTDTSVTAAGQLHLSLVRSSSATVARSVDVDDVTVSANRTPDTTAPTAPTGLLASGLGQTQVTLSWQPSTDAGGVASYQVLRDGVVVGTPVGTSFTDTGLSAGATYTYTVRALDLASNIGAASAPLTVTTTSSAAALFTSTFEGATGAAWPAGWTTSAASGGAATIVGNAGRLAFSNTSDSYARAQLSGSAARADSDVQLSYRWQDAAAKGYLTVTARGSGGWSNGYRPVNGYLVELSSTSTTVTLKKVVGGTLTTLATVTGAQSVSTGTQWVRLRVVGSTVQVKTWTGAQAEPAAWRATVTDTSVTAAGQVHLSYVRASTATAGRAVDVDDLTVRGA